MASAILNEKDTLVFGGKDLGGFNMTLPLVQLLVECTRKKYIAFGEGAALERMRQRGMNPKDFPEVGDMRVALKAIDPAVVVITCSQPIRGEQLLADAAQALEIPLVVLSDIRGAWKRIADLRMALVLTVDEIDAQRAREAGLKAEVVGFHQATPPEHDVDLAKLASKERHPVFLYQASGQPDRVEPETDLVLLSLAKASKACRVIFQPNPKIVPQRHSSGSTWGEYLSRKIRHHPATFEMPGPWVRYADATISPSSGPLTAVAMGRIGIVLRCEEIEHVLAREPGVLEQMDYYEQELGLPVLREPTDLMEFMNAPRPSVQIRAYEPETAFHQIYRYAKMY